MKRPLSEYVKLGMAVEEARLLDVDRAEFDPAEFPLFNVRDFLRSIYADAGLNYDPAGLFPEVDA
jgi:hypothetical protein